MASLQAASLQSSSSMRSMSWRIENLSKESLGGRRAGGGGRRGVGRLFDWIGGRRVVHCGNVAALGHKIPVCERMARNGGVVWATFGTRLGMWRHRPY
jgi:hypothetical protein